MTRIGAMVRNKNVDFMRAGQMARVKVDTINFARYGMDSDASSAPVYIAHVALKADTIVTEAGPTKLEPSMQLSAEIRTG